MAAVLGTHAYQSQRAASASLHPAVAVLIQAGPFYGSLARIGQAEARWRDPGGGEQSGMLTTVTAPGSWVRRRVPGYRSGWIARVSRSRLRSAGSP